MIPLGVVGLGMLVAVLPLLLLPDSSGPVAFALGLMQSIAVLVGASVVGAGLYSYRTGNCRPAAAAALAVLGLGLVGALGGFVEASGGPLIPIWGWVVAVLLVGVFVVVTTNRVVNRKQQQGA
jgi:peptidoglycan/LPS O-acetylase OafA/YrhL